MIFRPLLEFEQEDNDFLAKILCPESPLDLETFMEAKPGIDAGIADATNSELVCGLIKDFTVEQEGSIEIGREELKHFFQEHQDSLIIDVREPHEFAFAQDWKELGFHAPPQEYSVDAFKWLPSQTFSGSS